MPLDHTDEVDREGNLGSEQTGVSINLAKFCVTGGSRLVPSRLRDAHGGSRCDGNGRTRKASSFPSHPGRLYEVIQFLLAFTLLAKFAPTGGSYTSYL